MPIALPEDEARKRRLRGQRLLPDPEDAPDATPDVAAVVKRVGGIQAQDLRSAALSVRARGPGLTFRDVRYALVEARSVVRTWLMRGTIHIAPREEIGWLLSVFGPRLKITSRRRREQLGLDDATAARGSRLLEEVLQRRGPLTRAEIRAEPMLEDVPLDGQAAPHLIRFAALDGRVCYGPPKDAEPTYVALRDWIDLPAPPSADDVLARLARRYLSAYGPATPRDLAAWSGLTLTRSRKGFELINDERTEVVVDGASASMLAENAHRPDEHARRSVVRLLPKYDTLLLGYGSRDWILPAAHAERICPGGGLLRRSILADGRIVGTWDPERQGDGALRVVVELFEKVSTAVRAGLEAETEDVGHFFGRTATLEIAE